MNLELEQRYHAAVREFQEALDLFDELVTAALEYKLSFEDLDQEYDRVIKILRELRSLHAVSMQFLRAYAENGNPSDYDFIKDLSSLEKAVACNNNDKILAAAQTVRDWAEAFFTCAEQEEQMEKRIDFVLFAFYYIQLARLKIQITAFTHPIDFSD